MTIGVPEDESVQYRRHIEDLDIRFDNSVFQYGFTNTLVI